MNASFCVAAALVMSLAQTPPQTSSPAASQPSAAAEELWAAAREGNTERISRALARGADVNAKARYNMTALAFAADKGHLDAVKLLLDRGADTNIQDTFYQIRPIDLALGNGHIPVAMLLLERGSKGAAGALNAGIAAKNVPLVKLALGSTELTSANVASALTIAKRGGDAAVIALVEEKLKTFPPADKPAVAVDLSVLKTYEGTYRNDGGLTVTIALKEKTLTASAAGQPPLALVPTAQTAFMVAEVEGLTFTFTGHGGQAERLIVSQRGMTQTLERATAPAAAAPPATPPPAGTAPATAATAAKAAPAPVAPTTPKPWPAFRGANAAGNGDGQGAAVEWDAPAGKNVRWKTPIPGIATSSPIVWGNRVFVTTAISSAEGARLRTGLYGDVKPDADVSAHTWKVICLDRHSGKVLWEETAFTGVPQVKRHTKASQANSTPVTDGRRVVVVFGSIGLVAAYDAATGKQVWKREIGAVDNGWFLDPAYQWGHSSSPILFKDAVILQVDQQKGSFLAAFDLNTGKERWRTERDEISTWGTPAILEANGRAEIVTNGTKVRGYDAATGKLLWTLGPNSEITVGTPVIGEGLVYVTGGYPPVRPVYAIKPGGSGDISLPEGKTSSDAVAWSNKEGTYIPTPLFYQGVLYTLSNNGILSAYDAKTGDRLYRSRVGEGGGFSASPIAADGRLYLASEDGDVFVVAAGRTFQAVAKNPMGEAIMATPAISDGVVIVRTLGHVYAIGAK